MKPTSRAIGALSFALVGLAGFVVAGDGALEINQVCAVNSGCHAGDAPGFPVTISAPGGYVLTSNLTVANAETDAIELTADGTTIDLNGFELIGPVACTGVGSDVSCDGGSGTGINGPGGDRTYVHSGSVKGFGGDGIKLGGRAQVRDVRAESNGNNGISVGQLSTVTNVTGYRNGHVGILISNGGVVDRGVAGFNKANGISTDVGALVTNSTAYENGGNGVNVDNGSIVRNTSLHKNEVNGINAASGCMLLDINAHQNELDGIKGFVGTTVQRSMMRGNQGYGLRLSGTSTYHSSTITGNSMGAVVGTGVNMGGNYCGGAACP